MSDSTKKPTRFRWLIQTKLAGSARPSSEAELRWLQAQGIKCIVTLTQAPLIINLNKFAFEHSHLPIADFAAPTLEDMHAYVAYVATMLAQNKPVLTHCLAGLGRTGTMLAVYLVSTCKTPEEAINEVRKEASRAVETPGQEEAVYEYARSLGKCE